MNNIKTFNEFFSFTRPVIEWHEDDLFKSIMKSQKNTSGSENTNFNPFKYWRSNIMHIWYLKTNCLTKDKNRSADSKSIKYENSTFIDIEPEFRVNQLKNEQYILNQ